jgi:hypothetical protein
VYFLRCQLVVSGGQKTLPFCTNHIAVALIQEKGAIPLRTTQGDNCEGSSKRVFILFLFFYVYILPQSNLILHFILSK